MRSFLWCILTLCGTGVHGLVSPAFARDSVLVAAAADLQFALQQIADRFEQDTGARIQLTFGSSGNFARQLEQGAPFEVFFSADEQFVLRLAQRGLTRDRGALYAIGRIVLFAPADSALSDSLSVDGLREALAARRVDRFAIANPEHAPYGRAAQQWLQKHGLWREAEPRLVFGENAAQAARFATSGNAAGGIIPYSLALAPQIGSRGQFVLLSDGDHEPLLQRMVLMKNAGPTAVRFYAYIQSPAARESMRRFGFILPDERRDALDRPQRGYGFQAVFQAAGSAGK